MRLVAASVRVFVLGSLLTVVACSSSKPPAPVRPGSDGSPSPNQDGQGPTGNSGGAGTFADNPTQLGSSGAGGSAVQAALGGGSALNDACVTSTSEGQQVPVDMYIMLDRSASMQETTGAGPTKWDAIRDALKTFLTDPRSSGLGVGLQYFPIARPGVPEDCTRDSDCGVGGPCLSGLCEPGSSGSFNVVFCSTQADCPADAVGCTNQVGECAGDTSAICFQIGFLGCGNLGNCTAVTIQPSCKNRDSCDAGDYAMPAVPIDTLPDHAQALSDSLTNAMTLGLTPTSAALSGAYQLCKQRAQDQPSHRVITLLATDGTPTECDPIDTTGVGDLAKQALAGTPSVATYVIGVFGPTDTDAMSNLDAWAVAGGTSHAFIVDPTKDVTAQFLDALDTIRNGSLGCEYMLPSNPAGSQLDFGRVNVALVTGQTSQDLLYVGDASKCGITPLGWHYDVDPAMGTPTKIQACDMACSTLQAATDAKIEIRLGCKTESPE